MPATTYTALPTAPTVTAVAVAARHLLSQLAAVVLHWLWLDSTRRVVRVAFDYLATLTGLVGGWFVFRGLCVVLLWWDATAWPWLTDVLAPAVAAAAVAAVQL